MANFDDHIEQAKHNLEVLKVLNKNLESAWDWQVTISFYTAVHLINAHLAVKLNIHYRSHNEVENAINPFNTLSPAKLPDDVFLAYQKLHGLSRRSRYLIHEDPKERKEDKFATHDRHFSKSIKKLDIILAFINSTYGSKFEPVGISCVDLTGTRLMFFTLVT